MAVEESRFFANRRAPLEPDRLYLTVAEGWEEGEPPITICRNSGERRRQPSITSILLTLDEARWLVGELSKAIEVAEATSYVESPEDAEKNDE